MSDPRPILLIDDDPAIGMLLPEKLKDAGFDTVLCISIASAGEAIAERSGRFAAIILDVMLSDGDGRDFCRELRGRGVSVPIIMLSGAAKETDIVTALDWGANDYVVKPFSTVELMARLRAVLRVHDASKDASFDICGFLFRPAKRMWVKPGVSTRPVFMTDKECRLLRQLHHAGGELVSREALLTAIWGYAKTAATHTLESHVYRLRQKIEPDPSRPMIVLTSPGGYRLGLDDGE